MYPIAFSIGSIDIYWYGILMGCTFVSAYLIARYFARFHGVDEQKIEDLFFISGVVGLIGSRLGAVLPNWRYFLAHPLEIFSRAGMASHGAIIAIMIAGYFYVRRHKLNYWQIADFAGPILSAGHIFVRTGNFLSGELYGPPTDLPWAVEFPSSLVPVHPTQLYEVLASMIILPFAWKWAKNPKYHGYAFFRTLFVHSAVRFFLDFIRQHSTLYGPFVLSQIIALLICAVTLPTIIILDRRHKLK
ncbi:MAG: prolipoprotein diacylglyceryl transferase [Bacillota bacterium]|jgi:prolipoprotein diacylglyceryl transferase|nr:prolipoprotein diacylglyceryl transferase [Bacillota bacterium]NLJ02440.1 prolipoprotein diacylglyceryl transferase [Bacillota bacterium]